MQSARYLSAARVIAALTLGSRVLGLIRDTILGHLFGTTELLSAFRIAFLVPNLARRLFGEGALTSAMIPLLTDDLRTHGEASARQLVGRILTLLAVVLTAGIIAVQAALLAWRAITPDFALDLTLVLIPYTLFICTVAAASGALNVRRHFAAPAAAPMLLNVGIIGSALAAHHWFGLSDRSLLYAIAVGILAAGVAQVVLVGAALRANGFFPVLGMPRRDPRVATLLRTMGPMVLGLAAFQINTLADNLIAYFFIHADGKGRSGPAVIAFAQEMYQLPLGVFGIALATAIYPVLAERAAAKDDAGLGDVLSRGLRMSLFLAAPAAAGLIFIAAPLVRLLFEHGRFDASDTARVAGTIAFYSIGLPAYFVQHLLVRAFYALQDSRTPARTAVVMVCVNFALNMVLVFPLQERGLGLSTSITAIAQAGYLAWRLHRRVPGVAWRPLGLAAVRILLATGVMVVALFVLLHVSGLGPRLGTMPPGWLAASLAGVIALAVGVYALASRLLRVEELRQVWRGL